MFGWQYTDDLKPYCVWIISTTIKIIYVFAYCELGGKILLSSQGPEFIHLVGHEDEEQEEEVE